MSKAAHHPYNNIFVKTMSIPHFAERLVEHLAIELKGKIKSKSYKLATETFIDELLKPHLPDIIYEAQYEQSPAWLFLLFEHKSNLEHVKVQIGRYTFIGLHQQRIKWEQASIIRRKAKTKDLKKFKYRMILPIVLYHGQQKWKDRPFAELFDLPDDSFIQYIPDFNYILIDLTAYTDAYLEDVGDPLLSAILLLLKHKGDKEYVMRNAEKIFNFVKQDPDTALTKDFLETLIQFIYQTFSLKQSEVQDLVAELPTKTQTDMVSTWDRLIEQGKIEGIQIGMAKGIAKGIAKGKLETEIRKDLEFTLSLIKGLPAFTDVQIATMAKVESKYVKKVRATFSKKRNSSIKTYIRQLFKKVPNIEEKKWQELEKWGLDLWESFKK